VSDNPELDLGQIPKPTVMELKREGAGVRDRQTSSDVRFGSKADIGARLRHVRFTPESGHWGVRLVRMSSAISTSGHDHAKQHPQ